MSPTSNPTSRTNCICKWEQPPDDVVPLSAGVWTQTEWNPACPFDGENTERYAKIVAHARELAQKRATQMLDE